MKKIIQRATLAAIVGTFAVMTGCDQSNNSNMKSNGTNDRMQDRSKQKGMDQSAKPMPNGGQRQMQDQGQQMHGGSSNGGNGGQKNNGSQYHYYCD